MAVKIELGGFGRYVDKLFKKGPELKTAYLAALKKDPIKKIKVNAFEKELYETLRKDPLARRNFFENLSALPQATQIKILRRFQGLAKAKN
ncbi:MAG: hypothetical protein AABZ44_03300 [Elusimicrobiota bacterium]